MLVDSKAVEKLTELRKKDKGLFNKLKQFITDFFNKIKARYKNLNPTSIEAKHVQEIEGMSSKLQKLFEDALLDAAENQRIVGANNIANSPAKMEIKKDINGNTFVDVTGDILADAPLGEKLSVTLAKIISDKFHNIIKVNGQTFRINSDTNREWRRSPYSQKLLRKNEYDIYRNKQKALFNADELLVSARNWIGEKNEHPREDDIKEFARGEVWFRVPDGTGYLADILVATKLDDSALLYDILNLKEIKITEGSTTDSSKNSLRISNTSVTNESVSHELNDVNTKFQLKQKVPVYDEAVQNYIQTHSRDSVSQMVSIVNEMAELYMPNSKVRNSQGKLIKVYHGTEAGNFNKFDKGRQGQTDSSLWGRGYYFTSEYDFAEMFGDNIRSFYLNITNPFTVSKVDAPASEIADKLMALGEEIDFDYSNLKAHEFAKAFGNQRFSDVLASHGYDGVIVGDVQSGYAEYVAFEQNQMKLSDPVTYDDNGEVIPLSERFDDTKTDIRYQKKVDKGNESWDNVSRANKIGEIKNDLYLALSRTQWAKYYTAIAEYGRIYRNVLQLCQSYDENAVLSIYDRSSAKYVDYDAETIEAYISRRVHRNGEKWNARGNLLYGDESGIQTDSRPQIKNQLKSYAVKTDREILAQHLEENSQAVGEMCHVFFVLFFKQEDVNFTYKKIVKTSNLQTFNYIYKLY